MNVKVSETKESYSQILLSIERCISKSYVKFNSTSDEPLTLISGYAGNALFYGYSYKKFQDDYLLNQAFNLINTCVERINEIEQPSLYQGFTGIAWVIRHLVNIGVLDKSSLENLLEIDKYIEKTVDVYEEHIYYSLMYGLIGHGIYFTEVERNRLLGSACSIDPRQNLSRIVKILDRCSIESKDGITWIDNTSLDYHKNKRVIYNLGIPHGVAGIASFLSEMINIDVEVETCKKLLRGNLYWLLSKKNNFSNIGYYPSLLADAESSKIARLCWAYGDLCSSLAFLKGFQCLNEKKFLDESYENLMITLKRDVGNSIIHINPDDNQINAGILKGASGVILLTKKLNEFFEIDEVESKIQFWINRVLSSQLSKHEVGDFKSFYIDEKEQSKWVIDTGFLEGLSGIGLTFLSLSDPKLNDWQKVLLL